MRRISSYDPQYAAGNILASLGAFLLGMATLPFIANWQVRLKNGKVWTLDWIRDWLGQRFICLLAFMLCTLLSASSYRC